MAEETEGQDTGAEATGAARVLIILFVIGTLLGLVAMAWHYRTPDPENTTCANPQAHCSENQL